MIYFTAHTGSENTSQSVINYPAAFSCSRSLASPSSSDNILRKVSIIECDLAAAVYWYSFGSSCLANDNKYTALNKALGFLCLKQSPLILAYSILKWYIFNYTSHLERLCSGFANVSTQEQMECLKLAWF